MAKSKANALGFRFAKASAPQPEAAAAAAKQAEEAAAAAATKQAEAAAAAEAEAQRAAEAAEKEAEALRAAEAAEEEAAAKAAEIEAEEATAAEAAQEEAEALRAAEAEALRAAAVATEEATTKENNPATSHALCIVAELPSLEPTCTACGLAVDPVAPGTRLMSKVQQSYRCRRCNTKSASLHRIFGQWPLPQFRELSKDEQQDFFRSAGSDSKSLESAVTNLLSRRLVERSHSQTTGKFLPLSVWEKKGFDPKVIERDGVMEIHPVLGRTYQVVVKETGSSKWQELAREQVLELKQKAKCVREMKSAGSQAPAATEASVQDAEVVSSSSDQGRSSSSTSSSSKKKRKSKHKKGHKQPAPSRKKDRKKGKSKTKKDKRKRKKSSSSESSGERKRKHAKTQKEEEAARQRAVRKIHGDATKVVSKISSLVGKLEEIVAHPSAGNLPSIAVQKAKEQSKALSAMFNEARACLSSGSPKPLSFELEAVNVLVRDATDTKANCMKFLAALTRMT